MMKSYFESINPFSPTYYSNFKYKYSFEERCNEFKKFSLKHPNHIPIIVEKNMKQKELPELQTCKFCVPPDTKLFQLIHSIRVNLKFDQKTALFVSINGKLYDLHKNISEIYEKECDKDNFLYAIYSTENVFG